MEIKFKQYASDGSKRRMWSSVTECPRVNVHEWEKDKKFSVTLYSDADTEVSSERFNNESDALKYARSL